MSYKTILVHVDQSRHADRRYEIALELARLHGAYLVGAAPTGISRFMFPSGYHVKPGTLEASYLEPLHSGAERALGQFAEAARDANLPFQPRLVNDLADEALALLARYSDLVILSREDPAEALAATPDRTPEYVALTCARPILLVPPGARVMPPWKRVLLAWNGSKEASAAVRAAIPLMQGASSVQAVSFCKPGEDGGFCEQDQADLTAYLGRHGVDLDFVRCERDIEDGRALLAVAADGGYDLLVAGCYGHSQFRELFLGGVTRTLLREATLPVLLAR